VAGVADIMSAAATCIRLFHHPAVKAGSGRDILPIQQFVATDETA
jgi:hypothetical protein